MLEWGRELCGDLDAAERREWLCTNGIGGFASATVAGTLTRRDHRLLVAAQEPPPRRTLPVAQGEESAADIWHATAVGTKPWARGAGGPHRHRQIEHWGVRRAPPGL